jgi:hypothetical protein
LALPFVGVLGNVFLTSSALSVLVLETSEASAAIAAEARVPKGSIIIDDLVSVFGLGRSEGAICDLFIYVLPSLSVRESVTFQIVGTSDAI